MSYRDAAVAIISMAQQASPNCRGQIEFLRPQLYSSCIEVTQTPCLCSSVRNCSSIWLMDVVTRVAKLHRYKKVTENILCNNVTFLTLLTTSASAHASAAIANIPCPTPRQALR